MRMRTMVFGAAVGAAIAYLFDPERGGDRRSRLLHRGTSTARHAYARYRSRTALRDVDDATIVDRIRSEALGDPRVPAGRINVDVADGLATLRGELEDPALIDEVVERVRGVAGVLGVRNLLHTHAQEPAENKRAAIHASDRAARSIPATGEAIE